MNCCRGFLAYLPIKKSHQRNWYNHRRDQASDDMIVEVKSCKEF